MRHYKNFKMPRGLKQVLLECFSQACSTSKDWVQLALSDMNFASQTKYNEQNIRAMLVNAVNDASGLSINPVKASIVLHSSQCDIPSHTDRMAKTCFIVPLISTSTMLFYEEYERRSLAGAKLIRFNDYNVHGVSNPYGGRMALISVTLEER